MNSTAPPPSTSPCAKPCWKAGADLGIREVGFNALLSLRLEKSFGIWSAEFTQGYTAAQTGMDRWIDWDKDFIGRDAALKERQAGGPAQVLVPLQVDAADADASGFEPVWQGERRLCDFRRLWAHRGQIAHHGDGGPGCSCGRLELTVHIVGQERTARVIAPSPYDPAGTAMRV